MLSDEETEIRYPRKNIIDDLQALDKNELINRIYNRNITDMSDIRNSDDDERGYGKAIPYIGWYWRNCDFANKKIQIGNCGFIGIMENNKWDYPSRMMTHEEVDKLIELLDRVLAVSWGLGTDISYHRKKRLDELWEWMQTLKI